MQTGGENVVAQCAQLHSAPQDQRQNSQAPGHKYTKLYDSRPLFKLSGGFNAPSGVTFKQSPVGSATLLTKRCVYSSTLKNEATTEKKKKSKKKKRKALWQRWEAERK
ncbi:hypothetical protein TRVL_02130 [Trypanosoma vivax]|nr:hypothetical protein TRVL_02130 [Trypanosoma vivax]